jgi:long-chain acyl-CoA synthetase
VVTIKKTVFLTGAVGFIGTQIVRYLLEDKQTNIIVLVRAKNLKEAQKRTARNWWDWPELIEALDSRVKVVCGDVSIPQFSLDKATYNHIVENATHIIHSAADWTPDASLDELRKTNVQGTANVIELAKKAHHHKLKRFSHLSTAYVAGGRTGEVSEDDLTNEYGFYSNYEESKFEGEMLVQSAKAEIPVSVFRPSMVVGDSQTGAIKTFNTFYYPLRLYLTGKLKILPVNRHLRINIVPVDYVAKAVVNLTFEPKAEGLNFHLVAPHESLPTIEEMINFLQTWAKNNLNTKLSRPTYLGISKSSLKRLLKLQRFFMPGSRRILDALITLAPYFSENRQLQRDNVDGFLGKFDMKWQEFLPHLLEYATYYSFFHRSDRTVYEQVMFRLASKSYPITYFDMVEDEIIEKTGPEMRRDIQTVAGAFQAMGIGPGDRVALTGLNCTRYLTADIAIGLVGAVSVPIYYTSPPLDIDQILKASGAKLLLIGIPSLLQRVAEIDSDIPIISFCRDTSLPDKSGKKIVEWNDFLSQGMDQHVSEYSPTSFGDIATLRYSSGTTGKSKGAIFNHENLRYMGESTVSIMSWGARNHRCSYLSFLPMGHVVEGILATYSPYYISAPVSIYFLEDFRKLPTALPKVKPIIFFSVPRLYEKIWESLEKNSLGRLYLRQKPGALKSFLGRILKGRLLKQAGLEKCEQLISGSARFDEALLQKYRKLGIEIHNAYGLTEAPLVTLNRMGRNRIGTVGEPMPKTQVKIADDDEIMVKGPQVTAGYFDETLESPIKNGWLMTGDIGKLDEGSLIILGRKKELIKTSYGKCIYSGKIEGMLKEISGVSEAMIIGESKPYITGLIWTEKDQSNEKTWQAIDDAIREMNLKLSNPEKLKKWALLVIDLSTENGSLTPNLKLKRNVVASRYKTTIEALYGEAVLESEVHIGEAEKNK